MVVSTLVSIVDFAWIFIVIGVGTWFLRRIPIFVPGTRQDLTRWGALATVAVFVAIVLLGSVTAEPRTNHLANWLGINVSESLTYNLNIIRGVVLVLLWHGFISFQAVRTILNRAFGLEGLILIGYAIFLNYKLVVIIVNMVQKI